MPTIKLRSLLLVEERLLEAEYFLKRLRRLSDINHFHFEMNAFLSSCRSTTWLLQKEMSGIPGFENWWKQQQESLRNDKAAGFFKNLRNFSQKEGRVAVRGSGQSQIKMGGSGGRTALLEAKQRSQQICSIVMWRSAAVSISRRSPSWSSPAQMSFLSSRVQGELSHQLGFNPWGSPLKM